MIEIRDYTNAELLALKPIEIGGYPKVEDGQLVMSQQENPFKAAVKAEIPGAWELSIRWAKLHHWIPAPEPMGEAISDPFDGLFGALESLDGQRLWHEARGENGELLAVHPVTVNAADPAAVAAFEKRCLEMHDVQEGLTLAPKPFENTLATRTHISRGD